MDNVELDPAYLQKEQLDFVGRAVTEVFARGSFPEAFNAKADHIIGCGCSYMPAPIKWGSRVGLQCKMDGPGYKRECGQSCISPRGDKVLLMCPTGWKANCILGCVMPKFNDDEDRADFLEGVVTEIIETGYDYAEFDHVMTEQNCGCGKAISKIQYGTQVGFDCVAKRARNEDKWCAGYEGCLNGDKKQILIFCPDGYEKTCDGCKKTFENDVSGWMVKAMTGFIRVSTNSLDLQPRPSQVVDCGCVEAFKPIEGYGTGVGFACKLGPKPDRTKLNSEGECGTNLVCLTAEKENVLHVCPPGFTPNCETGCGYSWGNKAEL